MLWDHYRTQFFQALYRMFSHVSCQYSGLAAMAVAPVQCGNKCWTKWCRWTASAPMSGNQSRPQTGFATCLPVQWQCNVKSASIMILRSCDPTVSWTWLRPGLIMIVTYDEKSSSSTAISALYIVVPASIFNFSMIIWGCLQDTSDLFVTGVRLYNLWLTDARCSHKHFFDMYGLSREF